MRIENTVSVQGEDRGPNIVSHSSEPEDRFPQEGLGREPVTEVVHTEECTASWSGGECQSVVTASHEGISKEKVTAM